MRTKYLTIKDSPTEVNTYGEVYPDIMTFPINKFEYTDIPRRVILTQADITRFDLFSYRYYRTCDYTDILLWLNNYASYHDLTVGDEILVPTIDDINAFFVKYL